MITAMLLGIPSTSFAQLFDFYPDVPFSAELDGQIYLRNVLNLPASRDLQEIPDGSGRFLSMRGLNDVRLVSPGAIHSLYVQAGAVPVGSSEGGLSLAIHPGFSTPGDPGYGKFYTLTMDETRTGTPDFLSGNTDGFSHYVISEWTQESPAAEVFSGSSRELMRFDEGSEFHNTDHLLFGPDGYLYIGTGDDNWKPSSNDLSSPYGKILRIDPLGSNSGNGKYGIPADNPFVDHPTAAPEVYAYGLRNPWRMGFDRETGELYAGDSGHLSIEEVNQIFAGTHYGWPEKEGNFLTRFSVELEDYLEGDGTPPLDQDLPDPDSGLTVAQVKGYQDPLFELDRSEMNVVIGAVLYRGQRFPELQGKFIFGSWNRFHVYAGDPQTGEVEIIIEGEQMSEFMEGKRFVSFNEDLDGEIYISGGNHVVGLFALPDFNRSGAYDPSDVDSLCSAFGSRNSLYDLNGDLTVNQTDLDMMLEFADVLPGDLNLRGGVQFDDFLKFANSFGSTDAVWSSGDLDCDGESEFADFLVFSRNFGQTRSGAQPVPEPSPSAVVLLAMLLPWLRHRP